MNAQRKGSNDAIMARLRMNELDDTALREIVSARSLGNPRKFLHSKTERDAAKVILGLRAQGVKVVTAGAGTEGRLDYPEDMTMPCEVDADYAFAEGKSLAELRALAIAEAEAPRYVITEEGASHLAAIEARYDAELATRGMTRATTASDFIPNPRRLRVAHLFAAELAAEAWRAYMTLAPGGAEHATAGEAYGELANARDALRNVAEIEAYAVADARRWASARAAERRGPREVAILAGTEREIRHIWATLDAEGWTGTEPTFRRYASPHWEFSVIAPDASVHAARIAARSCSTCGAPLDEEGDCTAELASDQADFDRRMGYTPKLPPEAENDPAVRIHAEASRARGDA